MIIITGSGERESDEVRRVEKSFAFDRDADDAYGRKTM
jgi:hypothetical protein